MTKLMPWLYRKVCVYYSDNSRINMNEGKFKKCLQKGIINGKRNYYIYQNEKINGTWQKNLFLVRKME